MKKVLKIIGRLLLGIFAGENLDKYKIPFKHENLGSVPINKLSDVYGKCDMCLVLSGTNISLLPLEVMASGSVVVGNDGENN